MKTTTAKSKAAASFRKANPDAVGLTIEWTWISAPCEYADGSPGTFRNLRGVASADGFRTRQIVATVSTDGGVMVR